MRGIPAIIKEKNLLKDRFEKTKYMLKEMTLKL